MVFSGYDRQDSWQPSVRHLTRDLTYSYGCTQEIYHLSQVLSRERKRAYSDTNNSLFIPEEPKQLMSEVLIVKSSSE